MNLERLFTYVIACATIVSLVSNALLIPKYGYWAVAWVRVGTEFLLASTMLILFFVYQRKKEQAG